MDEAKMFLSVTAGLYLSGVLFNGSLYQCGWTVSRFVKWLGLLDG
jgi:hypothetical protein